MISVRKIKRAFVTLIFLTFSSLTDADNMPWTFNGSKAEGYSIDLVESAPAPGSPLIADSDVEFKVTVKYSMTIASHGKVIMVFQDERNRRAKDNGPFEAQEVTGSSGTLTLSDKVTVPKGAKELRLFVPLIPDGLKETDGEVVIRWPIKKK